MISFQFSTAMSVTMIIVAGLGLLGNTFSVFVLARLVFLSTENWFDLTFDKLHSKFNFDFFYFTFFGLNQSEK